jgi:predicted HicB family RNase H-like nuclease
MATKLIKQTDYYTYRITWSDEDGEYVGLCAEFPGLSWLDKTQEAALQGIRKLVAAAILDMESNNENVPQPLALKSYSGKFMVRIPPNIHRDIAIQAAEAKVSINRVVSAKLAVK